MGGFGLNLTPLVRSDKSWKHIHLNQTFIHLIMKMPHSRCNKLIKMWVEWPFNDIFQLEYVIMKKSTIMESFLVEVGLLEILTSFVVSNENYVGLQVLEY